MPIQNPLISRSIESAQKKVEGNNFDIRKQLVEYDDVINKHREAIYRKRREILEIAEAGAPTQSMEVKAPTEKSAVEELAADDSKTSQRTLSEIILDMLADEISYVVNFHTAGDNQGEWNLNEIAETMKTIFNADINVIKDKIAVLKTREEIANYLIDVAGADYKKMVENFSGAGMDFKQIEKGILVRSFDTLWIEHLETIDYLRRGIGLRGYGQHDPLVEYKKEAYLLYQELNNLIQKQVVYSIFKTAEAIVGLSAQQLASISLGQERRHLSFQAPEKTMVEQHSHQDKDLVTEKVKNDEGEKVGRNDLCPCGSGKKYKKCHGK